MIKTLREYEIAALRTAPMLLPEFESLGVFAMGLGGETGEVVDLLKKVVGHGHDLDKDKLNKELGDVLWYLTVLGNRLGFSSNCLGLPSYLDEIYETSKSFEFEGSGNVKTIRLSLRLDAYAGLVSEATDRLIAGFADRDAIQKNLVLCWRYVSFIAHRYEITLSDVATKNYNKLLARYPNGFNSEDSRNRAS